MGSTRRPPKPPKPPRIRTIKEDVPWGNFMDEMDDLTKEDLTTEDLFDPYGKAEARRQMKQMGEYDTSTWGMFKEIYNDTPEIKKWTSRIIPFIIGWIIMSMVLSYFTSSPKEEIFKPEVTTEAGVTSSKVDTGKKIGGID